MKREATGTDSTTAAPSAEEWQIVPADSAALLDVTRTLFREYADSIGIDLCFQNFGHELETLPGAYRPPGGRILLAQRRETFGGCVAVRPLEPDICEMKRLFVRPVARSTGLGRRLAEAIVAVGRELGYRRMRLDTLNTMQAAIELYQSLGFREIPQYTTNPICGALFFEATL